LIPDRIISIQKHTERLKDLISKNDRGWNELVEYESINLPEELEEIVGKEIVVYEGNRAGRVIVDSFGQRVIPSKQNSAIQMDLHLSPQHKPQIKVRNNSRTHDLAVDENLESHLEYKRVLSGLIRQTGKNWSDDKEAISVRFRKIDYPQKMSFVSDVQIPTPEIKNLGEFDSCTLKKVPIAPRTSADAQKWYEFRIVEGIDSYLTESGYENSVETQRENFARFGFDLQTPSVDEIIEGYSNIRDDNTYHPVYWFLSAPRDLSRRRDE